MRTLPAALLCSALLPLAACAGDAGPTAGSSGDTTVAASIYPLAWVAQRVAGDDAEVVDLVPPGAEAHDAELSLAQTAEVADADLVLRVEGLAPAVDDAVAEAVEPTADVEALEVLERREPALDGAPPVKVLPGDPHFWLDPRALATYAAEIEERLATLDPEHADAYRANGVDLRRDLETLDGEMDAGLDDCARRTVVVSHEAYGYLGYRYDLDFSALVGLSPADEPSLATLADLQELVEEEGVTTVFYEPLGGPAPVESLAGDLDLEIAPLDPVEGLTEESSDEDYLSLMAANLDALVTAGECGGEAGP